jgi:hypothetical protein
MKYCDKNKEILKLEVDANKVAFQMQKIQRIVELKCFWTWPFGHCYHCNYGPSCSIIFSHQHWSTCCHCKKEAQSL